MEDLTEARPENAVSVENHTANHEHTVWPNCAALIGNRRTATNFGTRDDAKVYTNVNALKDKLGQENLRILKGASSQKAPIVIRSTQDSGTLLG